MTILVAFGLFFGAAHEAEAQQVWTDQVYVNIGFGVESGSSDLNDTKTFTLYDEASTVNTTSAWTSGSLFDVSAGLRVWRGLSIGIGYHQEKTNTADVAIDGTAAHPLFFNRPRSFTGSVTGLKRKENATHFNLGWMVPIGSRVDVHVTAGPSFFRLQQDAIADVEPVERGVPFTEVGLLTTRATVKRSLVGFNAGVDAAYFVWQNDRVRLGLGGFLRFAGATTDVNLLANDVETKVGGGQFGFGVRIRF